MAGGTYPSFAESTFRLGETSPRDVQMLFYLVPARSGPVPPANRWRIPWHTKSLKILRGLHMCCSPLKKCSHCHQKLPTRGYRVPKCIAKADFGELQGILSLQNLQKLFLPKCMVCTMFSKHLACCGSSLCRLHAKKSNFNIMVSTFLCLGGAKETKICPLGHSGLPKDTKSCPK